MSVGDDAGRAALIWCPFGDEASAREAATVLVEEHLVACANIIPAMTSVFRWEGRIASQDESGVLFKTRKSLLRKAQTRLAQIHPYDSPAILGWEIDRAPAETLGWLAEESMQRGKN
ncbi:periplasmic divalent cation tolerance protein [Aurantiacibacter atlanticus]|uniref:Periplasmic divalent cation tolerance protein n=1 Tax=Aurantiacibacter atlanticus TaxID=1648404 RepID=A0A0H4VDZ0_9SPHN|nr:divalent-cation tolerance protein CutA [Aurantiacibacter atlanticus]AKQ41076.1 periplasmic divalent cation tolerance protein [Aurantiacibacter atlanticus]MDF1833502.1 divalent-cation tolerance protein CutA [Alteraurantiacibacter sp. bin_em_oilr2.035]